MRRLFDLVVLGGILIITSLYIWLEEFIDKVRVMYYVVVYVLV